MPNQTQQGLNKTLIWNDAQIYIGSYDQYNNLTWTEIIGLANFQPPSQTKNTVELPYINQTDGITWREKGSTSGGDISGTLNAKPENDASLSALLKAYYSKDNYAFAWVFPSGEYAQISYTKVTDCSLQGGELDTAISYNVSVACNSLVEYFTQWTNS